MSYQPQFTIAPSLLSKVEAVAALRERILGAAVELTWMPALQKDMLRPLLEAGLVEKVGGKKPGRYAFKKP